jgi:hypothetical protein
MTRYTHVTENFDKIAKKKYISTRAFIHQNANNKIFTRSSKPVEATACVGAVAHR